MRAIQSLPQGAKVLRTVDLQKDKKAALRVNILSFALCLAVCLAMHLRVSILQFFDFEGTSGGRFLRLGVLLVGAVAYIVLHELTHAAVMKAAGGGKVRFGFTGMYAYAGSEQDYFDKSAYVCIALAPLVVWGLVFFALQSALPRDWFWVIGFLQIFNFGGAAGDVYVTYLTLKAPPTVLVKDTGLNMTFYQG